ncbi:uncharacterized protein LOC108627821 isoform X3 [Ceratina calcarata]|uniref:Uncharacterized protein LOC108627821 isoform X3 n=1 Tax=Ceratina calcarata TaxID=156304 RepID=A0AAJ7J4S3_9HYME|nr:uncharacterized protein LOC108627821 isoform X3 [Ceratina calcarata]
MIKIIVIFAVVIGALAAAGVPETSESPYDDAELVLPSIPGAENLEEKAMPLSKLIAQHEGVQNLLEKSQLDSHLPGTKNLAEKRLPEALLRMSDGQRRNL